ncbi:MAG: 16S rRNA (guanine(527)-N(7))-methyltransferase RsmG [Bacteroidetes bacterium]|jgi:16S rRNA (guanine527-N7)-methyltransferase|nr:16S rRNA (guanine(527)-N(7))-methyltransferase RsmG [Bacteroidota bacterium]
MQIIQKYFTDFTQQQTQQFEMLLPLYKEWNEKINVISRKDIDELYLHHVLHSLTIATYANFSKATTVIDIGCGGGFPGIPLAIFFPETEFLLVDSIGKKLKVVNEICAATGIKNITTQHTRVEEIKNRKFDFAISRAVAPLKDLRFWSKPLLNAAVKTNVSNGLICLKGGDLHQEISESKARPKMMNVYDIFPEDYYKEKYLLHITR